MQLKEDDIVLCTVKKVEGTTVFVEIEENGEGSLVMSEIAAGRIRNLREYVAPNKKIVCKVLRIINNHPQLSLRRVTAKERSEILEKYKREASFLAILRKLIKNPEEKIKEIKESYEIIDFIEEAKENPELINKFFSKEEAETVAKTLLEREKKKEVKKVITLSSFSPSGLSDIKEILKIKEKEAEINYLGSSKFSISITAKNFKEANTKMEALIKEIERKAKQKKATLKIKEK